MQDLTVESHHRDGAGFTLMELMVALSIISIVFVSVFKMHSQTLSMLAVVKFDATAPLLAKEVLSELERSGLEPAAGNSGDFADRFPGYKWQVDLEDVSPEVLGEAVGMKRVEITISHADDGQTFRLRTYRLALE